MVKKCFFTLSPLFIIILTLLSTKGQEQLFPLTTNPALPNASPTISDNTPSKQSQKDTITLPFIDDFSYNQVYPANQYWEENLAYVNRHMAVDPPTIGVVTLDGLNEYGLAYNTGGLTYGPADTLTSRPINLSGYAVNDSIYLSFFYQPQGYGDFPDDKDSLVLEFKPGNDTSWHHIWSIPGDTFQRFQQKIVPLDDPSYFYNAFQFRFRNYASISGKNDHWNIDYIRLDLNRGLHDTVLNDVAIAELPTSLLAHYTAMPWQQFKGYQKEEIATEHQYAIKNNFTSTKSFNYGFHMTNASTGQPLDSSTAGLTDNIQPLSYKSLNFSSDTFPPYTTDSVLLKVTYQAQATGDALPQNDTISTFQPFYNYFAYDDGSAEKSYGTFSTGSKIAVRFTPNKPDTLQGVYMHFVQMNKDVSDKLFTLKIWSSITIGENKSELIYEKDFRKPEYTKKLNGFYYYSIDSPFVVSDRFYVGWQQSQEDILRLGFDKNTDFSQHNFFNASGSWENSKFKGSLMLRPVLGKRVPASRPSQPSSSPSLHIYPNPVQHTLHINTSRSLQKGKFVLYNNHGQSLITTPATSTTIDVTELIFPPTSS